MYGTVYLKVVKSIMYLNGSNSIKVSLLCVILRSAHKVNVFSRIELRKSHKFWITALQQSPSETVKCDKC